MIGGGSTGVTTVPHESDNVLESEDGDAPPDLDNDERWPIHAMDFFAKVKTDIGAAMKLTCVKEGDKLVGKFKGRMSLKYCG